MGSDRRLRKAGWLVVLAAGLGLALGAQERVEKIEVAGNSRVTRETLLYYLSVKEGDLYDEAALRRDFRVLWSTGFFSDIRIESDAGAGGRIVRIVVEENPVVKTVVYKTGSKLKEDAIVDKLKEKDEALLPHSYYSPPKVHRIRRTILDLLQAKGLTGGEVRADLVPRAGNELALTFRIKEGERMKVGEVAFSGAPALADQALVSAMKQIKPHGFISWIAGKDTFTEAKLTEDLNNLKAALQGKGYLEATVGQPVVEETVRTTMLLKKRTMKKIIIPIQAGERYSVGEVKVEGGKLIKPGYLRSLVKLAPGETYSTKARADAVEKLGETYRDIGYLYAQIVPVESLDPQRKRVNLTIRVSEGEPAFLRRLEFQGNVHTKDRALRREFLLREGDRFSLAVFKDSVLRLKQLGLVDLEKEPDITPVESDPAQIDATVRVKELQKNNLQFSAGTSGYEGSYIMGSYSTVNLLGAGESMEVMFQYGKRVKNYVFSFNEPYILNLPLSAGFRIYDRSIYYPSLYSQQSRGVSFDTGFRIKGFWRANLSYGFEYLKLDSAPSDDTGTTYASSYDFGGLYGYGNYYVGSLSPMLYRSTVDSPLTPSRGTSILVAAKIAGGILGGEIDLIKPRFEWTRYQPLYGKHVLGLHAEYEFIKPLRGSDVPFWERFYLGGERSLRGYEIYTIGPRNNNDLLVGGEKSLVLNAEYIIPVGGPLYTIFFCDAGNAYSRKEKVSLRDLCVSAGLEMRLFVPALRVPMRLIFAYNAPPAEDNGSHFAFRFAIGTSF